MNVGETKLGLTTVFTHEECKALGISMDSTTKEANETVRARLGILGLKKAKKEVKA